MDSTADAGNRPKQPEAGFFQETDTARRLICWAEQELEAANLFYGHGTTNALDEAVYLVFAALGLEYYCADELLDEPCSHDSAVLATQYVRRRIETRKPAAFITGTAWFAGLRFEVDEHVLIPRSPIGELIEKQFAPWVVPDSIARILDLGTGSGCIAIAAALAFPQARVDAVDISPEALAIARRNIERHGVGDRVELFLGDLFEPLGKRRYDLIVSNPPYVPEEEIADLPAEYHFEPKLGLAAGTDGLAVVERLLRTAEHYLSRGGTLVVEVGDSESQLLDRYPCVPFTWLEFERGGDGVFVLDADQVRAYFRSGGG
jgi:ribosomal protein L3 glutamine methyltransferase